VASRLPLAPALAALIVLIAALAGLAVLSGAVRQFTPGPLVAELRLAPMLLPSGTALDPLEISNYIEQRLTQNAERDVAIRMGLGPENSERLMTIIIPRLVNSTVISRMIDQIPPLGAVVALNRLRTTASIAVRNTGEARLADVAMTLPGIVLAEEANGEPVEIVTPARSITAVRLGTLAPGEERRLTAWLNVPLSASDRFAAETALGAAGGIAGQVATYGGAGWIGEDLNAYPWARWLVGGLLGAVAFAAFGVLVAILWGLRRPRRPVAVRPA
jgi:hypothetical protein